MGAPLRAASPLSRRALAISLLACSLIVSCRRAAPLDPPVNPPAAEETTIRALPIQAGSGKELFVNYCAACHGENGDGNGSAARFLYPRPRNFGEAQFRIVSTANNMPSDKDLSHVLNHGMPGSAMFSFGHLSESDKAALI